MMAICGAFLVTSIIQGNWSRLILLRRRRSDASDRRVKRLYLKKAGRQLLGRMSGLKSELTANALEGITPADAHRLLTQLETIKENVRNAIQTSGAEQARKEQRYG